MPLCEPHVAAERHHGVVYALIVGRDENGRRPDSARGTAVHVFNHWQSCNLGEGLSRQTGRVIAGGNYDDSSGGRSDGRGTLGSSRVHGEYYHTRWRTMRNASGYSWTR